MDSKILKEVRDITRIERTSAHSHIRGLGPVVAILLIYTFS